MRGWGRLLRPRWQRRDTALSDRHEGRLTGFRDRWAVCQGPSSSGAGDAGTCGKRTRSSGFLAAIDT